MSNVNQGPESLLKQTIAGYRLDRTIGTGASGAVYLGYASRRGRASDEPVAVKVLGLPWQITTQQRREFRARFQREAEVLARLTHPHILPLLAHGEQNGLLYMVLPYKSGGTLASLLARSPGPIPPAEAASLLAQLAGAIDYAHRRQVIHRDIKPANVLLDSMGQAFLADFSVARLIEETTSHLSLTKTGEVLGTDPYMAPEQRNGEQVGPEADIYGLGAILYELLTHQRWSALTAPPVASAFAANPSPAQSALAGLPPAAVDALMRALAPSPADRFHTAHDFADAFLRAIGRQDLLVEPPTLAPGALPPTRVLHRGPASGSYPLRRRRVFAAALAAAAVVALISSLLTGGFGLLPQGRAQRSPTASIANLPSSGLTTTTTTTSSTTSPHGPTPTPSRTTGATQGPGVTVSPTSLPVVPPASGSWSPTGNVVTATYSQQATTLNNGLVLMEGGRTSSGTVVTTAELYNPATGAWTATGSLNVARMEQTATLLQDGRVLVAGGFDTVLSSAEIYNPATGTWTMTGSMSEVRTRHTATLLPSGKVLVTGGWNGGVTAGAELYDPSSGTWSSAGSMSVPRTNHIAVLLKTGKVLIAGGEIQNGGTPKTATAELYDPATNSWSGTGSMNLARSLFSAVLLPSGKVLVFGGGTPSGQTATAELYDPSTGSWSYTGSMVNTRVTSVGQMAFVLQNGKVLAAGGDAAGTSETYNPLTGTWEPPVSLDTSRCAGAGALLSNGSVILASGLNCTNGAWLGSTAIYTP